MYITALYGGRVSASVRQCLGIALAEKVIAPAEGKVTALEERRRVIEAELTKPQ